MGSYMSGEYQKCIDSCGSMLKFDGKASLKPFEKCAVVLLWVRSLIGLKAYGRALKTIVKNKNLVLDEVEYHEICGKMQMKTNQKDAAVKSFEALLDLNSSNFDTYYHLIEAKGVALPEDKTKLASYEMSAED